ncbi:hypothetical protein GCM10010440_06680 [Kitasatospora cinereorecta]
MTWRNVRALGQWAQDVDLLGAEDRGLLATEKVNVWRRCLRRHGHPDGRATARRDRTGTRANVRFRPMARKTYEYRQDLVEA